GPTGDADQEALRYRRQRSLEQVTDASVVVGQSLRQADRAIVLAELEQRHVDPGRRGAALGIEYVGRDRGLAGRAGGWCSGYGVGHVSSRAWASSRSPSAATSTLAPAGSRTRRTRSRRSGACCRSTRSSST